jgi:hypothetical protein
MSTTNQYFFTKDKLKSMLDHFDKKYSEVGDRPEFDFKGLVFTPGVSPETGEDCAFAFPLIAFKGKTAGDNESMIVQSTSFETTTQPNSNNEIEKINYSTMGCLVPPPCKPPIPGTTISMLSNRINVLGNNDCFDK